MIKIHTFFLGALSVCTVMLGAEAQSPNPEQTPFPTSGSLGALRPSAGSLNTPVIGPPPENKGRESHNPASSDLKGINKDVGSHNLEPGGAISNGSLSGGSAGGGANMNGNANGMGGAPGSAGK